MAAVKEQAEAEDRIKSMELQMKDEFLSHISHEFRTPLASIYAFVTLISDRLAGEISEQKPGHCKIERSRGFDPGLKRLRKNAGLEKQAALSG
jgi:signal transduction histidine kinase